MTLKEDAATGLPDADRAGGSDATEWLIRQYVDIDRRFNILLSYLSDPH